MTDRTIDRLLERWLEAGPDDMPDRVVDVVAARIAHERQRPAWRLHLRRLPSMTPAIRLVAVVGLIALAAGSALILSAGSGPEPAVSPLASPDPSVSPAATTAASPTQSASAAPLPSTPALECRSPQAPTCRGSLAAGTYASGSFGSPFTYTVPEDWWNLDDWTTTFQLHRYGDAPGQQILLHRAPGIAPLDDDCSGTGIAGKDATVDDWVAFLTTHPGLAASEPASMDVGGRSATYIDIALRDDWTRPCPFSEGRPFVRYATDLYWPFEGWGIGVDERRRVILVEAPSEAVVVIEVDTTVPERFEPFLVAALPIVESITFE